MLNEAATKIFNVAGQYANFFIVAVTADRRENKAQIGIQRVNFRFGVTRLGNLLKSGSVMVSIKKRRRKVTEG